MRKIKVFHIIAKLELGGAQRVTLATLAGLDRKMFEPGLITGIQGMLVPEAKKIPGLKCYLIPSFIREISIIKDITALYHIYRILKKERVDIVHTHGSKGGVLGRIAAFLARVPIAIHSVHGFSFNEHIPFLRRWFYIMIEWFCSFFTDHFFLDSKGNIERGLRFRILSGRSYSQLPPGIELDPFRKRRINPASERERLGLSPGDEVVLTISCLKPQKAPQDFVKMAALVAERRAKAKFLLVGDGELRPEVERLIRELDLEGKVLLLGWQWDVLPLLTIADVFVLTSLWEGLPTVIPMAYAAGKPVVATEVDGSKEVVIPGETGFLVPPHDVAGLAEKVSFLLSHPGKAKDMGEKGRKLAQRYDIKKMIEKQRAFYLKIYKNQGKRRLFLDQSGGKG
ncbi:MAG: glycosyltransferase family 4 protein [Acidobacteria bacterium]|nr:glycosyltransferase family 4 protein [Acidobacteriota bacterium]